MKDIKIQIDANFYPEKVAYLRDYKFSISIENRIAVGYTSEKMYNAMQADCIPIYYGNPSVHRDFNTKSFINGNSPGLKTEDQIFD